MRGNRFGVAIEVRQVIERIGHAELARIDQTHERITNPGTFALSVKESILAVEDCLFECPFTNVVIKGGPSFSEEQCQRLPMFEHIVDGLTKVRVGLYQMVIELSVELGM